MMALTGNGFVQHSDFNWRLRSFSSHAYDGFRLHVAARVSSH